MAIIAVLTMADVVIMEDVEEIIVEEVEEGKVVAVMKKAKAKADVIIIMKKVIKVIKVIKVVIKVIKVASMARILVILDIVMMIIEKGVIMLRILHKVGRTEIKDRSDPPERNILYLLNPRILLYFQIFLLKLQMKRLWTFSPI